MFLITKTGRPVFLAICSFLITVLHLHAASSLDDEAFSWGYDRHNGPHLWSKHFPAGIKSERQSPIDIRTSRVIDTDNRRNRRPIPSLRFSYNPKSIKAIDKECFSFVASFRDGDKNELSGGVLDGVYQLAQLHAHWGSEHLVDGKSYPAELHMVHYNKKKYGTVEEAKKHQDGLAVLAVFLKIGRRNAELQKLIDFFPLLVKDKEELPLRHMITLDVKALLPTTTDCFWTYEGSLTVPPLLDVVTWTIFQEPIEISLKQLKAFRSLHPHNSRPVQRHNRRIVLAMTRGCPNDE